MQYQFAVSSRRSEIVRHAVALAAEAGLPSSLAVMKRFGPASPGPLSFPVEGWTLALDFAVGWAGLPVLLDRLDELVAGAGGRVYLAKDARLRRRAVADMYPRASELAAVRRRVDPEKFCDPISPAVSGLGEVPAMNDAFGRPQSVVVLGGTSDIAMALVDGFVAGPCQTVVLAARDAEALDRAAQRASVGGAEVVETVSFDAADVPRAPATVAQCFDASRDGVDLVVVALGLLGESERDASYPERVAEVITANFTWPAAAMGRLRCACGRRAMDESSCSPRLPR